MTAQALADRCTELGLPLDRAVIAKLEKGHRQTITVGEILVLAKALEVPPLLLIFPIGQRDLTEVLPGRTVGVWDAAKWFTGEQPLVAEKFPDRQEWLVDVVDLDDWHRGALPAESYREHDRLVAERRNALIGAAGARHAAEVAKTEGEKDAHLRRAEVEDKHAREYERALRDHRSYMRRNSITPPELDTDLIHLDDLPEDG